MQAKEQQMLDNQRFTLPWDHKEWDNKVTDWISAQLAAHGLQAKRPVELLHKRLWSALAKLETSDGILYFKALAPHFHFEVPVSKALAEWQPANSLRLLASDSEQGWMLSWEAGQTLRSLTRSPEQLPHWYTLLPRYAEFQIELASKSDQLLAWGMPDRRLQSLPTLYQELLGKDDQLLIGHEDGLSEQDYQKLQAGIGEFSQLCAQLDSYGLPVTLVHEELHENNVLFDGERHIFMDWSDASVGHPFFTLIVTLRATAYWLKIDPNGPELARMRDAYLEPFTRFATRAQLDDAAKLALRLGMFNRALSWSNTIDVSSEEHRAENLDAVPSWLKDYLYETI
jgi:hypothetical protein